MGFCNNGIYRPATCGTLLCGGENGIGRIYALRTFSGLPGVIAIGFEADSQIADRARVALAVDGEVVADAPASGGEVSALGLGDGVHDIGLGIESSRWLSDPFVTDGVRNRARVRWTASPSDDVRSYRIYEKQGIPGDWTLAGTQDRIEAARVAYAPPDGETTGGRVTVLGAYRGDACNVDWHIQIVADDSFKVDPGTGTYGDAISISRGAAVSIGGGMTAVFHDAPTAYTEGDTWTWRVGPRCEWVSDDVDGGVGPLYGGMYYRVNAVDGAGNESANYDVPLPFRPDYNPLPPTSPAVTYAGGTFSFTFSAPESWITKYRLYSNYSKDFGDLETDVIFDYHLAEWTCEGTEESPYAGDWTPDATPDGEWMFTIRAYNEVAGRDSKNNDYFTYTLPDGSLDVAAPFDVSATAGEGGTIVLSWYYDTRNGTPTAFNIYQHDTETPVFTSPVASPASTITGVEFGPQTWTSDALGAQKWFTVRAVVGGAESANVDVATDTPDATAPDPPSAGFPVGV